MYVLDVCAVCTTPGADKYALNKEQPLFAAADCIV